MYRGTNEKPQNVHIQPHQAMKDKVLGEVNCVGIQSILYSMRKQTWGKHAHSTQKESWPSSVLEPKYLLVVRQQRWTLSHRAAMQENTKNMESVFRAKTVGCQNRQNFSSKTAQRVVKICWAVVHHDWDYSFSVRFQELTMKWWG